MQISIVSARLAAVAALACIFLATSSAPAGTTGALTGRLVDNAGSPIAGARITATSPSESVSTTSTASGAFSFVSLSPDTYTLVASKDGYESVSQTGITVVADNTRTITLTASKAVKLLGRVDVRDTVGLVRPGTTTDVYSINSAMQSKVKTLGGGGDIDTAYAAISSVPGVVLSPGQNGWNQSIYIRGGNAYQVGYEFDGVPVLRTYDDYPTTNASTIGQQELQVYTGAAPANSESQGLAGYINQVIKQGTYPGWATLDLGLGAPTLYNKFHIELGGATQNRNFSYYLAVGAINQNFRSVDASNGDDISALWGSPWGQIPCPGTGTSADANFAACYTSGVGPGGYYLGPYSLATTSQVVDRENVVNLHFGIPHRTGGGRDDIQLLYDVSQLWNQFYSSATDWGLPFLTAVGNTDLVNGTISPSFYFYNGYYYTGAVGQPLNLNTYQSQTIFYNFPGQPNACFNCPIPVTKRDANTHGQALVKIQYQHNLSSSAYFRIYAYDYYSDWLQNGFDSYWPTYIGCCSADYELGNRTHGLSASFADQISDKHLINLQASFMGATDLRMRNTTVSDRFSTLAYLVNTNDPMSGVCYDGSSNAVSCYSGNAAIVDMEAAKDHEVVDPTSLGTCGTGACEWLVTDNGIKGGYNHGKPSFTSASIMDQFKPSDRWFFNLGIRYDRYSFKGGDTTGGPTRPFFFRAWNIGECIATIPGSQPIAKPGDPSLPCMDPSNFGGNPQGLTYVPATLTNLPNLVQTYSYTEPRVGGTYTINSDNVLRFSYGFYTESPSTAYEQYDALENDLPSYDGPNFYGYGFNTTSHAVQPEQSYNTDLSWEHHFTGTDASFKLTPFLRRTRQQLENFVLDPKTGFISGLNAGRQTASGVEFEISKGDFERNGLSALLSFTYTNSYIEYGTLPNGGTVLDSTNLAIQGYNAYTSFCANNPSDPRCGQTSNGVTTAACYDPSGNPDPSCAAGDIANPYWNAPVQPLFDIHAKYKPFDTIPGSLQAGSNSYLTPYVATLILNYKHDKWAIAPNVQFFSGNYYGAPLVSSGIDPALGCSPLTSGSVAGDPRYPYGAAGGAPYDATTCNGLLTNAGGQESIPNPYTGKFDAMGAFLSPNQLLAGMQLSYAATSRVTLQLNLTNLISTCFGGTKQAWTVYADRRACGYGVSGYGLLNNVGNLYNPGSTFQPIVQYPYMPSFSTTSPFGAYLDVQLKL
jgi:hypothetical protein